MIYRISIYSQTPKPNYHCYLESEWMNFDNFIINENYQPNTKYLSLYPESIKEYNDNIKQCKTAEDLIKFWCNWFTENYPEIGFKYTEKRC